MVSSYLILINLYFSASKGRSNLLLNRTKRFKREAEEKERIDNEKKLSRYIEDMENEIQYLKDKIVHSEKDQSAADKNREILSSLFDKKIIDEDGNLL